MKIMMVWRTTWMMMMEWNKEMKMRNGNGRMRFINLAYQNIPLGLSTNNKEEIIDRILRSCHPHLIGIAEPRWSELEKMHLDGYKILSGMANGINNPSRG